MKVFLAFLLLFTGIILIAFSILVLVMAFDTPTDTDSPSEYVVYLLGKIIFPLLLTVFGRWVFRKGVALRRENK